MQVSQSTKPVASAARASPGPSIASWDLCYDHSTDWGLVSTPAARDSASISEAVGKRFPFVNIHALHGILENVFDNVANYGREGCLAKGAVTLTDEGSGFLLTVTNKRSSVPLPAALHDHVFTKESGIVVVPGNERDGQSGGGAGISIMTKALPHIYWKGISCDASPSLRWREISIDNEPHVSFELRVPYPSYREQRNFLRLRHHRRIVEQAVASSDVLTRAAEGERTPDDTVRRSARLIERALELAFAEWADLRTKPTEESHL